MLRRTRFERCDPLAIVPSDANPSTNTSCPPFPNISLRRFISPFSHGAVNTPLGMSAQDNIRCCDSRSPPASNPHAEFFAVHADVFRDAHRFWIAYAAVSTSRQSSSSPQYFFVLSRTVVFSSPSTPEQWSSAVPTSMVQAGRRQHQQQLLLLLLLLL